jgi:hypothetical protein
MEIRNGEYSVLLRSDLGPRERGVWRRFQAASRQNSLSLSFFAAMDFRYLKHRDPTFRSERL